MIIYNVNIVMVMGSVEVQVFVGKEKEVFFIGWGGIGLELDVIWCGELDVILMCMGDDVGVVMVEVIKVDLEGRVEEFFFVFLGWIIVVYDQLSVEELDVFQIEVFCFLGVGVLER